MNKKSTAIFLLFLWIVQWSIPNVFRQLEIYACQIESDSYINQSERQIKTSQIFYGLHDLIDWEKTGKELVYKGQHYDVISIIITAKGSLVNCYQDKKEDLVIANYTALNKQNRTANNPYSKLLKKIIDQKYITFETDEFIQPVLIKSKIVCNEIVPVENCCYNLNYPPPEIS